MSLIKDDEFVIINIDENNEISDINGIIPTEYIQMNTIKYNNEQYTEELSDKIIDQIIDETIDRVIDETIDGVIDDAITNVINNINNNENQIIKNPIMKTSESQTDLSYSNYERKGDKIEINIKELNTIDHYNKTFSEEEEEAEAEAEAEKACLQHYKLKRKKKRHRKRNVPKNENDCLSGFKRFIKYIFNF